MRTAKWNKSKAQKAKTKLSLPTMLLMNVQSLRGKSEELAANLRYQSGWREACILAIMETWLQDYVPDAKVTLDGYTLNRRDRNLAAT
eukprot:superscaffoldBa00005246_g20091